MSLYICERCNYSTRIKCNYQTHLKRKKPCVFKTKSMLIIEKQEIEPETIVSNKRVNDSKITNIDSKTKESKLTCEYCLKIFSRRNNLPRHYLVCKAKKLMQDNEEILRLKSELEHTKSLLLKSNNMSVQTENKRDNNSSINGNQNTNITGNQNTVINNNISINNYMTPERVIDIFEKHYNIDTLSGRDKALAAFVIKHFLLGEDKPVYLCTDRSRKIFRFEDENGDLVQDLNAQILIKLTTHGFDTIKKSFNKQIKLLDNKIFNSKNQHVKKELVKKKDILDKEFKSILNITRDGLPYQTQLSKSLPNTILNRNKLIPLNERELSDEKTFKNKQEMEDPLVREIINLSASKVDPERYIIKKIIGLSTDDLDDKLYRNIINCKKEYISSNMLVIPQELKNKKNKYIRYIKLP